MSGEPLSYTVGRCFYSVIYLRPGVGRRDPVEVNIFGRGRRNGREVVVIGESKSQLSAKNIDHFIQGRLTRLEPLFEDVFPILVTHMISSPDVAAYAQERGIALYYSYQF